MAPLSGVHCIKLCPKRERENEEGIKVTAGRRIVVISNERTERRSGRAAVKNWLHMFLLTEHNYIIVIGYNVKSW